MLSPSDRLEIHELYARYADAFDHGHCQEWAELFTVDGRFDVNGEQLLIGRGALEAFARGMYSPPGMRHFVSNIVIAPSEQGATGKAYVQVLRVAKDASLRLLNMGEYDDQLVRDESGWLLSSRRFTSLLPAALADAKLATPRHS